jgi:hypothetical protein
MMPRLDWCNDDDAIFCCSNLLLQCPQTCISNSTPQHLVFTNITLVGVPQLSLAKTAMPPPVPAPAYLLLLLPVTGACAALSGGTRTCIHTPGAPMLPEEMTQELITSALQDAALVYFDGRLTEAALLLARAARAAGVAVLVEAERLRPGLQDLLQEADYVVTSAHFPQVGRVAVPSCASGSGLTHAHDRFMT